MTTFAVENLLAVPDIERDVHLISPEMLLFARTTGTGVACGYHGVFGVYHPCKRRVSSRAGFQRCIHSGKERLTHCASPNTLGVSSFYWLRTPFTGDKGGRLNHRFGGILLSGG